MEIKNLKKCKGCGEVKDKATCFYRAGPSYQSRCKPCHIAIRRTYKQTPKVYVRKPTGYARLPPETQQLILEMYRKREKWKTIALKTGVKYATLLKWKRENKIPLPIYTKEEK
jgi:hypothetical protein